MIATHLLENPVTPQPPVYADCTTIRLLVAHQIMGSIIGKGGSKIKEIQEESGAKLVISKDMLPQSTERVIDVFGLVESIKIAVFSIAECMVADAERATGAIPYNPQTRLSSPSSGLGLSSHHNARTGRPYDDYGYSASSSPSSSSSSSYSHHNGGRRNFNSGGAGAGAGAGASLNGRIRTGSFGNAGGMATATNGASTTPELTQTLPVPTDMVGCIIGMYIF
jgi:heterogeneous nuclear rnp K-like protein